MQDIPNRPIVKKVSRVVIAALCLSLLISGLVIVQSDEVAVVLRFGKLSGSNPAQRILAPGIHLGFPRVIDEVVKIPVGRIQQVTISTHNASSAGIDVDIASTGYLITGDQNIMLLGADVKYQITDPIAYVTKFMSVENVILRVVGAVLREKVSQTDVDTLLTTGKTPLSASASSDAQQRLDALGCGVSLVSFELTSVTPPSETMADFEAVIAAGIKKETLIQQANEYRVNAIPAAQSTARTLVDNAKVARNEAVSAARNDLSAFMGLYEQYRLNPTIVTEGVIRERVSALLAKMRIVVAQSEEGAARVTLP